MRGGPARNRPINLEDLTEDELDRVKEELTQVARKDRSTSAGSKPQLSRAASSSYPASEQENSPPISRTAR